MKKYSIQDLRNGKCAVKYDSTLEELQRVMRLAFPNSHTCFGEAKYYFSHKSRIGQWTDSNSSYLPYQSVKDFLEEEFKYGDIVSYNESKCIVPYFFIGLLPKDSSRCVISYENSAYVVYLTDISKYKPPLELTLKEVAEKFGVGQVKIIDL